MLIGGGSLRPFYGPRVVTFTMDSDINGLRAQLLSLLLGRASARLVFI